MLWVVKSISFRNNVAKCSRIQVIFSERDTFIDSLEHYINIDAANHTC